MAIVLCFLLCACGGGENESSEDSGSSLASIVTQPTPKEEESTQQNVDVVVVNAEGVNIRSGASTESEVLTVAYKDDAFYLVEKDTAEGWHKIKYNNGDAFVSADYSEVKSVTEEEAKTMVGGDASASESTEASGSEDSSQESSDSSGSSEESSEDGVKAEETRTNEDGMAR